MHLIYSFLQRFGTKRSGQNYLILSFHFYLWPFGARALKIYTWQETKVLCLSCSPGRPSKSWALWGKGSLSLCSLLQQSSAKRRSAGWQPWVQSWSKLVLVTISPDDNQWSWTWQWGPSAGVKDEPSPGLQVFWQLQVWEEFLLGLWYLCEVEKAAKSDIW